MFNLKNHSTVKRDKTFFFFQKNFHFSFHFNFHFLFIFKKDDNKKTTNKFTNRNDLLIQNKLNKPTSQQQQ
jgi:hypothetical protein